MARNSEADILKLLGHCEEISSLGNDIFKKSIRYKEKDHFSFMAICFSMKQLVHMKTLLLLTKEKHYPDCLSIARSMIEGMAIQLWAANKPDKRGKRWRAYALVSDYKLILEKEKNGEHIPAAKKRDLLNALKEFGRDHFKGKNPIDLDFSNDPFRSDWLLDDDGKRLKIQDVFKDVSGESHYQIFREMSDWAHWSPAGVGGYLKRNDKGLTFEWDNYKHVALSLSCGFQSLLQTLEVLNIKLKLGVGPQLKSIGDKYRDEFVKTK